MTSTPQRSLEEAGRCRRTQATAVMSTETATVHEPGKAREAFRAVTRDVVVGRRGAEAAQGMGSPRSASR